jgi:hypothetical protein
MWDDTPIMRFPRASGLKGALYLFCYLLGPAANAQFKEIGPPPFSAAVARQRIGALLDKVDPSNRQQTLDSLNALTPWFRNILDEELIAGWQRDNRERLTLVVEPLADLSVAAAVVEFSWRKRTEATLDPDYAPMLGHLMARYPESGNAFLSDLLGPAPPELSLQEAETVCRILLDMPDVGTWHQSALQILPRYRSTAERLLRLDRQGDDQEKSYRSQIWMAELRGETPGLANQASVPRRRGAVIPVPNDRSNPTLFPPPSDEPPRATVDRRPDPIASNRPVPLPSPAPSTAPAQPLPGAAPVTAPPATGPPARAASLPAPPPAYNGAMSGTLECRGGPVPQNAEYVFRNLPPLKMRLDYDQRVWEARLTQGENQTQRLILRNKSSGPQKLCVVHWSIVP